ncbi:unnamed protein product [Arctia plantaginis]|uniref:Uncharacterized protein n=1 Tax=Arctia plantaginis TaxID=874455 RepID=A0A8S0Z740_ARCPL|nr:unnamed protein product [Arctia plantaginis]
MVCAAWQRWRAAAGPPPRPPSPAVSAGVVAVLALGTLQSFNLTEHRSQYQSAHHCPTASAHQRRPTVTDQSRQDSVYIPFTTDRC